MNENNPVIGVVILSRYSSRRLPGKALRTIRNKPILQYIVERTQRVFSNTEIVIATSIDSSDDKIEMFASQIGVECYRGSLSNVAERFYHSAYSLGWDYAVRINGDNIFVDTDLLAEMTSYAKDHKFDFISNVKGRTYPKGMSIEIVKVSHFFKLLPAINLSPEYQEHVTLYLYEHEDQSSHFYFMNGKIPQASGIQLALDTIDDFKRTERIIREFSKDHVQYNLREIFDIYERITNERITNEEL